MRDFQTLLAAANADGRYVGVRLDVREGSLPYGISGHVGPYGRVAFFLEEVVRFTRSCAAAYIFDPAFFCPKRGVVEANGPELMKQVIAYIKHYAEGVPVIIDGRYCGGVIANRLQAEYVFGYLCADAVTVSPLLGMESLAPFFDYPGAGVFTLCTASEPGADQLLGLLMPSGQDLGDFVAKTVSDRWRHRGGLMVDGAASSVVACLHKEAETSPLMIDGDLAKPLQLPATIAAITKENPVSFLVTTIWVVHASTDRDFAPAAEAAATRINEQIKRCVPTTQPA